ncbi:conserved hypothetical protein [Streptomyces pristinaespiralis ATCC 25486]|uniref:Uncharacterized protein n=1 Tax=Streptomyces pristinaespiralis (strain ATCC 25486 / DSM 40338 / CBS 914.69 / JCM 4507 / KCC S-0507 / NBRC 13074 / NRRL 2958 / 5647) TaxID=457429 RepID=B5H6K1_STRE2|nr:conserved hypothetical protein [Streptomyces pristinaespiralis ATCC 25486]
MPSGVAHLMNGGEAVCRPVAASSRGGGGIVRAAATHLRLLTGSSRTRELFTHIYARDSQLRT